MTPTSRCSTSIAVVVLLWIATTAGAQTGADTTASEPAPTPAAPTQPAPVPSAPETPTTMTLLHGGVTGELLAINVPRGEDEIQKLLDQARSLVDYATSKIDEARRLVADADHRAKEMDQEMRVTKEKRGAAKKAKDKDQQAALDATYKQQSREQRYLMQLGDALRADIDRLESSKAAAAAQARALELELRVVGLQAKLGSAPAASAVAEFSYSLRGMLEAQRDAANKGREASDKRRRVAEERLKQLDALAKLEK